MNTLARIRVRLKLRGVLKVCNIKLVGVSVIVRRDSAYLLIVHHLSKTVLSQRFTKLGVSKLIGTSVG